MTSSGAVAVWNVPFSRGFFTAFGRDLVWIGISDRYELRGYDPLTGSLRRMLRLDRALRPVRREDRERFFERQLAQAATPEQERAYREVQRIIDFPPTMPAFADLTEDSEGESLDPRLRASMA